jgi:phosphotransferase system enzyme I (PtsI)
MCGEMAGDIMSIPILLGMGLDAFSMSATSIAKARMVVNSLDYQECKTLATQVIDKKNEKEVNELMKGFLKNKNLLI